MHFVTTRDASRLTGLSIEQLREWTSRRELILPDVKPKGHGSPAQYTWQTIILLRLAVVLRDNFKLELQSHRDLFSELKLALSGLPFISLWNKSLAIYGGGTWQLIDSLDESASNEDFILLKLNPHLQKISDSFSFSQPSVQGQFQLFPAIGLASRVVKNGTTGGISNG